MKLEKQRLSHSKRELLDQWLRGTSVQTPGHIPKRKDIEHIPISFTQQRQLFLELLKPNSPINNLSICIELNGRLDVNAIEQSANLILERHDVLRTRFTFDHGLPAAEIANDLFIQVPVTRIEDHSGDELHTVMRQAEAIANKPFELTQAPLVRLNLFRLDDRRHVLLVVVHHSIADDWSLGIFLEELIHHYRKLTDGGVGNLSTLPIQYADYATWQGTHAKSAEVQAQLSYWSKQLSGSLPVLQLSADRARQSFQSFKGATWSFDIQRNVLERLEVIGRSEDATLFIVLLTAYFILLSRYSGQDEMVVGIPVAGRQSAEVMHLMGPFINILPIRSEVGEDSTFRELLRRVRGLALDAFAHQEVPFEMIVEKANPKRDLSHSPIFQTVFNMRKAPKPRGSIPGLDLHVFEVNKGASEFDLALMVVSSQGRCEAIFEYCIDLFESSSIERMASSFEGLLQEIAIEPDSPLSSLRLKGSDDYSNDTSHQDFPREKCTHELFEAEVLRSPSSIAVKDGTRSQSYSELNNAANAICELLRLNGARPGDMIGVCMERSLEIVEVLLGIHKSGCIYVPIHPTFPADRINFIIEDAGIKLVLTNLDLQVTGASLIKIGGSAVPETKVTKNFTPRPSDPAYIIYTSGSTGNPKGVIVPHSALTNLLWSMKTTPGINGTDVLLSVTSITFDIAALELFLPLIAGATVVIAGKEMTTNPSLIAEAVEKHNVSIMQATPATWQMLIDWGWKGNKKLKALCGGDIMTRRLAEKLVELTGELWNMYGPTETTIWSTLCRIESSSAISIGTPINNTQAFILDKNLLPALPGAFGELCIGGEGLAVGYVNNVTLTNHKFINWTYGNIENKRLFRTGDKARRLPNQSIEIVGRMDDQVKIYGHRIDLSEVTAALLQHKGIRDAIVLARPDNETPGLTAYFVSTRESLDSNELKEFMQKTLPRYMIPSSFIELEKLPLTPNGKIDRSALPAPYQTRSGADYVAPRNEFEKGMVEIWQQVLGIELIGVQDNFFSLGGASIQSVQIVSMANRKGLKFSPEDIFECQTVERLGEKVLAMRQEHNFE